MTAIARHMVPIHLRLPLFQAHTDHRVSRLANFPTAIQTFISRQKTTLALDQTETLPLAGTWSYRTAQQRGIDITVVSMH